MIRNFIDMHKDLNRQQQTPQNKLQRTDVQNQNPTLPIIPIISEASLKMGGQTSNTSIPICQLYCQEEKVIPGYNFQSLFRKKSHIRLARKKHKEQSQKRSSHPKVDPAEKQEKNIQKGHWTAEENKKYHWFLQIHSRHFILKYLRRTDKIFKNMAAFISTREAEQCRSHHQKMEKKYHSFHQILLKLRMDFYNTGNPQELKVDLQEGGFKLKEGTLITEEQLKNGDLRREKKQEQGESDSLSNDYSQDASPKEPNNLLNQNYQNNLEFQIPY